MDDQQYQETTIEQHTNGELCQNCSYRSALYKISHHREVVDAYEGRYTDSIVLIVCEECLNQFDRLTGAHAESRDANED